MGVVEMPSWTDQDVDDIVMGSGAEEWPWYRDGIGQVVLAPGRYGEYTVDLGYDADISSVRFSRDDFRRVAGEVAEGRHGTVQQIVIDSIIGSEPDPHGTDVVIQIIAFGEVRYQHNCLM